jgi:phosphoglycerate dehydrogenase-like enzyme
VIVLVADLNLEPHRERLESALPSGCDVQWCLDDVPAEVLGQAEVFVGSRFDAGMAAGAQRLRLVHAAAAGVDRIDLAALSPEVLVANTFNHERSIAEYVLAAAVLLRRGFLTQDRALRDGVWSSPVYDHTQPQRPTLGDARVGFVGFGHIGRQAWQLLRVLGCRGAAVTGSGRAAEDAGLDWVADTGALTRLMDDSDVVVVSAPLSDRTVGMIGAAELAALGAQGVLVNVGRGPLIEEEALYRALASGTLGGAAIDVWYRYPTGDGTPCPPSSFPFADLPNVLMTPHSSGVTLDTFAGRADDIAANIGRLVRGEPLHDLVRH